MAYAAGAPVFTSVTRGRVNISSRSGPRTTRPANSSRVKRSRSAVVDTRSPAAQPSVARHTETSRSPVVPSSSRIVW